MKLPPTTSPPPACAVSAGCLSPSVATLKIVFRPPPMGPPVAGAKPAGLRPDLFVVNDLPSCLVCAGAVAACVNTNIEVPDCLPVPEEELTSDYARAVALLDGLVPPPAALSLAMHPTFGLVTEVNVVRLPGAALPFPFLSRCMRVYAMDLARDVLAAAEKKKVS